MNDLISRQAAIEAVGEIHPLDYNAQSTVNRIKKIPSAQEWIPITSRLMTLEEQIEASRVTAVDFNYFGPRIYTRHLPNNGQRVLVWDSECEEVRIDTFCVGALYKNDGICWFKDNGEMDGISHWMPLPEPPRDVKE